MDKLLESLRETYNTLIEVDGPKVLYHRSSKLFKEFVPVTKQAFGPDAVAQPIFFKETREESMSMGGVGNYLYTVNAHLVKTFNPADMYDWDKAGGSRDDINAFTDLGKLVYKTYLKYNPNKYDDAKFNQLMYIRSGAYDAIENSNFLAWLQKNKFDSFYVSENGRLYEDKSVGVFVAPGKLEITKVEEI
jgi:hypothetical protein